MKIKLNYGLGGIAIGNFLALLFSLVINKSVLWGIVHFFCTWFYVIWAFVVHNEALKHGLQRLFS